MGVIYFWMSRGRAQHDRRIAFAKAASQIICSSEVATPIGARFGVWVRLDSPSLGKLQLRETSRQYKAILPCNCVTFRDYT